MSEWQPIETAPRDGTWFLICREGEGPEHWELAAYAKTLWPNWVHVKDDLYRKDEQVINEWAGASNMHRATHWTPLPDPLSTRKAVS